VFIVLMCGDIVLHTGLSISGTACQVILLMLVAFLYSNTNSVSHCSVCLIVFFCWARVSVFLDLCVQTFV